MCSFIDGFGGARTGSDGFEGFWLRTPPFLAAADLLFCCCCLRRLCLRLCCGRSGIRSILLLGGFFSFGILALCVRSLLAGALRARCLWLGSAAAVCFLCAWVWRPVAAGLVALSSALGRRKATTRLWRHQFGTSALRARCRTLAEPVSPLARRLFCTM